MSTTLSQTSLDGWDWLTHLPDVEFQPEAQPTVIAYVGGEATIQITGTAYAIELRQHAGGTLPDVAFGFTRPYENELVAVGRLQKGRASGVLTELSDGYRLHFTPLVRVRLDVAILVQLHDAPAQRALKVAAASPSVRADLRATIHEHFRPWEPASVGAAVATDVGPAPDGQALIDMIVALLTSDILQTSDTAPAPAIDTVSHQALGSTQVVPVVPKRRRSFVAIIRAAFLSAREKQPDKEPGQLAKVTADTHLRLFDQIATQICPRHKITTVRDAAFSSCQSILLQAATAKQFPDDSQDLLDQICDRVELELAPTGNAAR